MAALWFVLRFAAGFGYVAMAHYVARTTFGRKRPYTEPLSCNYTYSGHEHSKYCYQRKGTLIETPAGAAACAVFYGLAWPVTVACFVVASGFEAVAARWTRPEAAERAAAIRRLERELDGGE